MFVIFSSFVFGLGLTYLMQKDISVLSESIPFILILIDLSKATRMAKFAMTSKDKEEVQQNIGTALAYIGPSLTLDTLVTALAVGVGVMSGVEKLELVCFFGCATILSNFVVFISFFPATLALAMEVCPSNPTSYWRLDDFLRDMQEEKKQEPNPVVQRVKLIMSLGLVAVHLHSHSGFLTEITGVRFPEGFSWSASHTAEIAADHIELVPFHQYLLWKLLHLSNGQLITLLLAVILVLKYIIFDKPAKIAQPESQGRKTRFSGIVSEEDKEKTLRSILKKKEENGGSLYNGNAITNPDQYDGPDVWTPAFLREVLKDNFQHLSSSSSSYTSLSANESSAGEEESKDRESRTSSPSPSGDGESTSPLFAIGSLPTSRRASVVEVSPSPEPPAPGEGETKEKPMSSNETVEATSTEEAKEVISEEKRTLDHCSSLLAAGRANQLDDQEVINLVEAKRLPSYKLESALGDPERGVSIRRSMLERDLPEQSDMSGIPYKDYDYSKVMGSCCENVIGYMPVPVGVAGPLLLDGDQFQVPMATTEGCLVASTNRGCRAIASAGGVKSYVVGDGMTRAPVIRMPSAARATALKLWFDNHENFDYIQECFNSTSRFAKLKSITVVVAGRLVYIRFKASTGDAMGMNMVSKGVEHSLKRVQDDHFPDMQIVSLSGNFCVDKKPSAINWIEGRGKSVVCEAVIPGHLVKQVLKTEVQALVEVNVYKNLVGSAMAGSIGGFNAHAANIVTAIYIATGQDPAQNVGSSNCLTMMEACGMDNSDLRVSCTMPSIEVGTIGGGTLLPAQEACLKMLGVHGSNSEEPGLNSSKLARIVCATVLAGELSLISALAAGHLVRSHMTHNRSRTSLGSIQEMPAEVRSSTHKRSNSDVFK
jgi:hydroxymethylglutaryl-CoA reductase (NADPH)